MPGPALPLGVSMDQRCLEEQGTGQDVLGVRKSFPTLGGSPPPSVV